MNKSAFLRLIQNASFISAREAEELEELVVNFPYCQTAHLLIAKSAYDRGSMLSNQKLRKAASYATNRQLLKKLIYTTEADVTLREVQKPAYAAEAPEAEPAFAPPAPPAEGIPARGAAEVQEEEQPETVTSGHEPAGEPQAETAGEPTGEPESGDNILEEAESAATPPEWEELIMEPPGAEEAPEAEEKEPVLEEEEPLIWGPLTEVPQEEESAPAAAFEPAEDGEDPHDELAGLLYIDRIMPYRHLLPEQAETLREEEEGEPIPLPQFANPSLTEEEIAAIEELVLGQENTDEAFTALEASDEETQASLETGLAEGFTPPASEPEVPDSPEEGKEQELAEEETLSQFDAFLFNPERESLDAAQRGAAEEEVTATYPADVMDRIYAQNQLGYWMNSSRLGESLEVKNELTSARPFYFHPELILEYVQVNEVEKQVKPVDSPLDHQLNLIDQFLKMNPRLKQFADAKVKPEPQEDLSYKSTKIKKSLASENLASIFLKQGKVKKAIKIYEHLIVKIPEKKAYFASQIEKLRSQG